MMNRSNMLLVLLGCVALASAYTPNSSIQTKIRNTSSDPRSGRGRSAPSHAVIGHPTVPKLDYTLWSLRAGAKDEEASNADRNKLIRELVAEFIGTFILIQLGSGSVMSDIFDGAFSGLFQVAACWAIAVTIAISTTSSISGAHLNPSISFAFALLRGFQWSKVVPYALAQTMGAIAASSVNLILFSSKIAAFEKANGIVRGTAASVASARAFGEYFSDPITTAVAFFAEALGTAILAFVVFCLSNPKNDISRNKTFVPPLIGAAVAALIAVLAPVTQCGLNPARDFGPRVVAWLAGWKSVAFRKWWVYVLAPLIGAPVGAAIADKVLYEEV